MGRAGNLVLIAAALAGAAEARPRGTGSGGDSSERARSDRDSSGTVARRDAGATYVTARWQLPRLELPDEPAPTETLAQALDSAYRSAPELQARRYELRAADEDYAQAQSELRLTSQLQVTGNYSRVVPGRTTQANRSLSDRLNSPTIENNGLSAEIIVDQPLYTGGKATADMAATEGAIFAGRADLRGVEGDLFLRVITAYADIRRDARVLSLRRASVKQLEATYYEVMARRNAGELTRTDIAQVATQLDNAMAMVNLADQQLEQDRSAFAALVGHYPGVLAPPPALPMLPRSLDEALGLAQRLNPELAQAVAAERASRARIAGAAAEGHPRVSLRGTARLGGQAVPFYLHNEDQEYTGQVVLTIPLSQGGRTGSLVEQARDRNAADRERIEAARRAMVQSVVDAWNAGVTAQRNLKVQTAQLRSAEVLDDGTFQEYRAGLRSTFDVLYAHGSLRDAEIALESTQRDLYVAQATLLRHLGLLEARTILTETPLYDPDRNTRDASRRGALPWDPALRALDRVRKSAPEMRGLDQPALPAAPPQILPAPPAATSPAMARQAPGVPLPGTTGAPVPLNDAKHP